MRLINEKALIRTHTDARSYNERTTYKRSIIIVQLREHDALESSNETLWGHGNRMMAPRHVCRLFTPLVEHHKSTTQHT